MTRTVEGKRTIGFHDLDHKLKLLARFGELSGVEIASSGLGKKSAGDLALRRLASAVLFSAMVDLMDEIERDNSNDFFYSSRLELWCGILELDIGCVREALEDLGMLSRRLAPVPGITTSDIMSYYLETCESTTDSNPEVLLELSRIHRLPYFLIHYYIYEQILPWKHALMRKDLGDRFFTMWRFRVKKYGGKGSTSHFSRIIEAFRARLTEKDCA